MSMPTAVPETQDEIMAYQQWFFKKTVEMEHEWRVLDNDKRKLKLQRDKLERERKDFCRQKEADARFRAQEERLLQMKQQVLEEELKKLASEKQHLERERAFFNRVKQYQQKQEMSAAPSRQKTVRGDLFFIGVDNEKALKKRYKDLIKIYHPDNASGDTDTLKEINREYHRLSTLFTAG